MSVIKEDSGYVADCQLYGFLNLQSIYDSVSK